MAGGDLYQIRAYQMLGAYQMLNVFFYLQTEGTGGAEELAYAYESGFMNVLKNIQSEYVSTTLLEVVNTDDDTDFFSYTPVSNTTGTRTGDVLPPHDAWAFRLNRATRAVRNGYKRFGGVAEQDQAGGSSVAGILTALGNVATKLADDLTDVVTSSAWSPRIVRRTRVPLDPQQALDHYEYTPFAMSNAVCTGVSTQSTRKPGRGM